MPNLSPRKNLSPEERRAHYVNYYEEQQRAEGTANPLSNDKSLTLEITIRRPSENNSAEIFTTPVNRNKTGRITHLDWIDVDYQINRSKLPDGDVTTSLHLTYSSIDDFVTQLKSKLQGMRTQYITLSGKGMPSTLEYILTGNDSRLPPIEINVKPSMISNGEIIKNAAESDFFVRELFNVRSICRRLNIKLSKLTFNHSLQSSNRLNTHNLPADLQVPVLNLTPDAVQQLNPPRRQKASYTSHILASSLILVMAYRIGKLTSGMIGVTVMLLQYCYNRFANWLYKDQIKNQKNFASPTEARAFEIGLESMTWKGYFNSFKKKEAYRHPLAFVAGIEATMDPDYVPRNNATPTP